METTTDDGIYSFEDKGWNNPIKTEKYKKELSERGHLLNARQKMPLDLKIIYAQNRIRKVINEYGVENCVVSFSGGKDSTVLSDIVTRMGYKVDHYYINTRLEYPECVSFAKKWAKLKRVKLIVTVPDVMPEQVWKKYGYPMFTKEVAEILERIRAGQKVAQRKLDKVKKFMKYKNVFLSSKCCDYLKKKPARKFFKENNKKVSILGTTAAKSMIRRVNWIRKGCIYSTKGQIICNPIVFFTEKDIYDYAKKYKIKFAEIYYLGMKRNGCFCCGFGCHLPGENNFQILRRVYPMLYKNVIDKWGFRKICKQCDVSLEEYKPKEKNDRIRKSKT
jgi:3'-phosphoadenosine 5'-phosphosulfate sulfotransferase (PAPS reductase)/FAD synthetase